MVKRSEIILLGIFILCGLHHILVVFHLYYLSTLTESQSFFKAKWSFKYTTDLNSQTFSNGISHFWVLCVCLVWSQDSTAKAALWTDVNCCKLGETTAFHGLTPWSKSVLSRCFDLLSNLGYVYTVLKLFIYLSSILTKSTYIIENFGFLLEIYSTNLFRLNQLEFHASSSPGNEMRIWRVVQKSYQKLPKLKGPSSLVRGSFPVHSWLLLNVP